MKIVTQEVSGATHYAFLQSGEEEGVSLRLQDGREFVVWEDGTTHEALSEQDNATYSNPEGLEKAKGVVSNYISKAAWRAS